MNINKFIAGLTVYTLMLILTGCANLPTKSSGLVDVNCDSTNTNSMLKSGDYREKVDNFLLIQDTSSTMSEERDFKTFNYDSPKLELSKELLVCLNNTLPDNFDVNAGMRVFGAVQPDQGLIYGMNKYNKQALGDAVNSLGKTGGVTPIANAIASASADLYRISGSTAVVLLSDGLNTEAANPVAAAVAMKEMYGDKICIYTVLIGNDPKGRITMDQIADAGKCGYATDIETIGKSQGMNTFVSDVFLARKPKVVKPQEKAVAPTPKKIKPPEIITLTLFIEFDFDKDVIRTRHYDDVKKIADTLKKYPGAKVELEGHTDHEGSEEYNMGLSKRRAESVKKYLVEKFEINTSRISTVGYGESRPAAPNDTSAGRQRNRRVVAKIE